MKSDNTWSPSRCQSAFVKKDHRNERAEIQDKLYEFPYHYIPRLVDGEVPCITRVLDWGIEYLTYMSFVKQRIEQLPGHSILDIGCGDGFLLNSLVTSNGRKVGIDNSETPIRFAKAFATDAEFRVEDLGNVSETFEVVCLTEVLEHIPNDSIAAFVDRAKERVSPGGHLLITVPTTVVPLNAKHYRHYDETILDSHFGRIDEWENIEELRLYRHSKLLRYALLLLHNRLWTINSKLVWRLFWSWHEKHNAIATKHDGVHLLRIYKRKNTS